MDAEHCRSMAADADRLADLVSYTRDKDRLREQAETWRIKARALEAEASALSEEVTRPQRRVVDWLLRRTG